MTALAERIRVVIAHDGPMPLDRYMALCLGDPRHGYYATRDPFGRAGDFVTAPEISQIFGELIGLWVAQVWRDLGAPSPFNLVELGPGRGTLLADALRAMRVVPACGDALRLHLVETSPVLREAQRMRLADLAPVDWHDSFADVPAGPSIVLANEFFDALPIRQYVRQDNAWHERLVGLDAEGRFTFGLAPMPSAELTQFAPEGALLEITPAALATMSTIAGRIADHGGAALVIDYGHVVSGFGETLQALRHGAYADPLDAPGDADLTAHVDFAALAAAARTAGATSHGPTTQAWFLDRLGIGPRAGNLMRLAESAVAAGIEAGVRRLTDTGARGMGRLFKVLAVTAGDSPPPGFELPDPLLAEGEDDA